MEISWLDGCEPMFQIDKGSSAMAAAARTMGRPEAAARIVDECYALVRG